MKISRRGLAGVAAGAVAAASQKDQTTRQLAPTPPYSKENSPYGIKPQPDTEYYSEQIKSCKKILSEDFSDVMYQFENNNTGRMYSNIDALKSISPAARQTFIENVQNRRRKKEIIENARAQLDKIMGLPFSVTGILFND